VKPPHRPQVTNYIMLFEDLYKSKDAMRIGAPIPYQWPSAANGDTHIWESMGGTIFAVLVFRCCSVCLVSLCRFMPSWDRHVFDLPGRGGALCLGGCEPAWLATSASFRYRFGPGWRDEALMLVRRRCFFSFQLAAFSGRLKPFLYGMGQFLK